VQIAERKFRSGPMIGGLTMRRPSEIRYQLPPRTLMETTAGMVASTTFCHRAESVDAGPPSAQSHTAPSPPGNASANAAQAAQAAASQPSWLRRNSPAAWGTAEEIRRSALEGTNGDEQVRTRRPPPRVMLRNMMIR